jgi:hypothetical protein
MPKVYSGLRPAAGKVDETLCNILYDRILTMCHPSFKFNLNLVVGIKLFDDKLKLLPHRLRAQGILRRPRTNCPSRYISRP